MRPGEKDMLPTNTPVALDDIYRLPAPKIYKLIMGSGSTGYNPKKANYNPDPTFDVPRTDNKARRQKMQQEKEQKQSNPQGLTNDSNVSGSDKSVSRNSMCLVSRTDRRSRSVFSYRTKAYHYV